MKKLLTYNSLDKCYNNHQIKGDIALHSIFIELLSSVLSLTEEAMITYQQKIFNDEDLDAYINPSKKIIISQGDYSIEDLESLIKKDITDFSLKLNKEDRLEFQLDITTRVTFTKNLLLLIGFPQAFEGKWFSLGPHIAKIKTIPKLKTSKIYVYCKQLCKSTHLIDGKYTNCLYTTPLLVNQTIIFHSPAKPIYLPVEHPTRYLEFKILDQKGKKIPIKNIVLQVLNK